MKMDAEWVEKMDRFICENPGIFSSQRRVAAELRLRGFDPDEFLLPQAIATRPAKEPIQ